MKISYLILSFFLYQISFSQTLNLVPLNKGLSEKYRFVGKTNESTYFFERAYSFWSKRVLRYNDFGVLLSNERAQVKEYKNAHTYSDYAIVFNNKLLIVGHTKSRKNLSYWFVVETELNGSILKEPKELFAIEDNFTHPEIALATRTQFKEIGGQLYFFLCRDIKYKEEKSSFHVARIDGDLNVTTIFNKKLDADEKMIVGMWHPQLSETFASLILKNSDGDLQFGRIDFKKKEMEILNFSQLKNVEKNKVINFFIDDEKEDIIIVRGYSENYQTVKLNFLHFDRNFKKKEELTIDISNFLKNGKNRTATDLIKSLSLLDVHNIAGNWVLSFQYREFGLRWRETVGGGYYVRNGKRYYEEFLTLAISKTNFRAQWATIINRKQLSSTGINGNKDEAHYLGVHIAFKDDKLFYIFNTHKDNAELTLKSREDKVWKRKSDSRIMMVELSADGELRHKMLTKKRGSLYFEKDELVSNRKGRLIDARKGSPFLVVKDEVGFKFGFLNF